MFIISFLCNINVYTYLRKDFFKCYHLSHLLRFKFQHVHYIFFLLLSPQLILFFTCTKNITVKVKWCDGGRLVVAVKATGHNTYFIFYNFLLHLTQTRYTTKTLYVCVNIYMYCMYIFLLYGLYQIRPGHIIFQVHIIINSGRWETRREARFSSPSYSTEDRRAEARKARLIGLVGLVYYIVCVPGFYNFLFCYLCMY